MKQIELRKVALGECFRLSDNDNAAIWVRDEYDRSSKEFGCHKFFFTNVFRSFKGSRLVYVED